MSDFFEAPTLDNWQLVNGYWFRGGTEKRLPATVSRLGLKFVGIVGTERKSFWLSADAIAWCDQRGDK